MTKLVKDYKNLFDAKTFLKSFLTDPKEDRWLLLKLHDFWKQFNSSDNLSLLEYGGGPNIRNLISACPYVESIVFSEYVDSIRQEVNNWINNEGFDWKVTFDFIVQELEGQDEMAARKRENELRSKIKGMVPCDITASNPLDTSSLPANLHPPYDVVFTSSCVSAVVESDQEYREAIAKLAKLVKPGGYLILHEELEQSFYKVGEHRFYGYKTSKALVEDSFKLAGIHDVVIDVDIFESPCLEMFDTSGEVFIYGKK